MSNIVSTKDVQFTSVIQKYDRHLTADQIRALPYVAHGVPASKISKIIGVPSSTVDGWLRSDLMFREAISEILSEVTGWHNKMLNQAANLAWDRIFEILETDYPVDDKSGRKEQAITARFIIDTLGLKTNRQEIKHEIEAPELNVSEESADIIARHLYKLQNEEPEEIVDAEFRIADLEESVVCHPDTDFGVVNKDGDKMQCHVCGEWHKNFYLHVERIHGLEYTEYKSLYGLAKDLSESNAKEV